MLFIIHLSEILYLSYLSTRCSSEPKLGYRERYQWDGDEARKLLREPSPWADNNMWTGWQEKAGEQLPRQMSTAVNESAVVVMVFSVPMVLTVFGLDVQLSKKPIIKSV